MKFKKLYLVIAFALLNAGCTGAWWQQLRENPLAALQEGSGYIRTALGLAQTAFNAYAQQTGTVQPGAVNTFNHIVGNVQRGLQVANDGLRIAQHARGPAPDANALLNDARAAMGDVAAFLTGLRQQPGQAADPLLRDAIAAAERAATRPAY